MRVDNNLKKGVLSTSVRQGTNSVPTPPAQYATLLHDNSVEENCRRILEWIVGQGTARFGIYAVGIDLLMSGGLRLSEILYPNAFYVNGLGQVLIKGRKGSADKLVTPLRFREWWQKKAGWCSNPFSISSRWAWYRFFKSQGVVMHEAGKVNDSVTHTARKLQAHSLFNAGIELESVRDVMGHRSERSTLYYQPKKTATKTTTTKSKRYGKG